MSLCNSIFSLFLKRFFTSFLENWCESQPKYVCYTSWFSEKDAKKSSKKSKHIQLYRLTYTNGTCTTAADVQGAFRKSPKCEVPYIRVIFVYPRKTEWFFNFENHPNGVSNGHKKRSPEEPFRKRDTFGSFPHIHIRVKCANESFGWSTIGGMT